MVEPSVEALAVAAFIVGVVRGLVLGKKGGPGMALCVLQVEGKVGWEVE